MHAFSLSGIWLVKFFLNSGSNLFKIFQAIFDQTPGRKKENTVEEMVFAGSVTLAIA